MNRFRNLIALAPTFHAIKSSLALVLTVRLTR